MEKIFFIQKLTTDVQKAEYIRKSLEQCLFKVGDVVKVKCQNSPELVVESIEVATTKNYELDCVYLENRIKTLMFNKGSQGFTPHYFSEAVLTKITKE
jgi:hypothetical protein